MIGLLTGFVVLVEDRTATITLTSGVGYEVRMGAKSLAELKVPCELEVYTRVTYSENAHTIYGFKTVDERKLFDLLVAKVDGVGPKSALSLVDMGADRFKQAIREQNKKALTDCEGVGTKTAEKILLEFKGKFGETIEGKPTKPAPPKYDSSVLADLVGGLRNMGYDPNTAKSRAQAVLDAAEPGLSLTVLITRALKK
jgi:Holliday junction DNA helicase RuvA